ncbi:MAG: carboxypeptidase regulatory-like domain-containing protein [Pyrinomonadaceae bacterium]
MKANRIFLALAILGSSVAAASSQVATGGSYILAKSVISNGGGETAATPYSVNGTIGQGAAGSNPGGGTYSVRNGFWESNASSTAAGVTISGRVLASIEGRGVRNALVSLTDSAGVIWNAMTTAGGFYRFDEVESGKTYVISVRSRRFSFAPQVISVTDNLTGIDFIGQ